MNQQQKFDGELKQHCELTIFLCIIKRSGELH